MNEKAIDARTVGSTVKIETIRKVLKKYLSDGETSQSLAIARALEDATRDVQLTPEDWRAIADEMEKNRIQRHAKRNSHF